MLEPLAAVVFAIAAAVVIAFQLGLALGAPWGAYTMGGARTGALPIGMRIAAAIQAGVIAGLTVIVLSDARVALESVVAGRGWLVWVAVAFSALSAVLNAITRSSVERRVWLPVALVLLVSSLAVAVL